MNRESPLGQLLAVEQEYRTLFENYLARGIIRDLDPNDKEFNRDRLGSRSLLLGGRRRSAFGR